MLNVKKMLIKLLSMGDYRELLWANTSASNFGAQTIPLDLSAYDAVDVEFSNSTSSTNGVIVRARIDGGGLVLNNSGKPTYIRGRYFTPKTNGVDFANGTNGTNDSNEVCIPRRIWGVKLGGGVLLKGILTPCRKVVGVC